MGTRVKEQVYRPDWTEIRIDWNILYLLFEILEKSSATGRGGKCEYITSILQRISCPWKKFLKPCLKILTVVHWGIEKIRQKKGLDLHLGLEPEPLGSFETTDRKLFLFLTNCMDLLNLPIKRNRWSEL